MDKDAVDRLRYLCTVPTHCPADLEELREIVEELLFENAELEKQLTGLGIMYDAAQAGFETMKRRAERMERDLREHKRYPSVREIAKAEGITVSNAWRYLRKLREGYRR